MDTSRSPAESSGFSRKIAAALIIVYTVVTLIPNFMDNNDWI